MGKILTVSKTGLRSIWYSISNLGKSTSTSTGCNFFTIDANETCCKSFIKPSTLCFSLGNSTSIENFPSWLKYKFKTKCYFEKQDNSHCMGFPKPVRLRPRWTCNWKCRCFASLLRWRKRFLQNGSTSDLCFGRRKTFSTNPWSTTHWLAPL